MNPDSPYPVGHERLVALVGAFATLLVIPVVVVGGSLSFWMPPVVAVAAFVVFAQRDSAHGLVALAATAFVWLVGEPKALSAWSVAVALLLFTAHTSLALRTTAPPATDLDRVIVVRWLRRSAVVAVLTAVVYLVALAIQHLHQSDAEVVLAAALAALGVLVLLLRSETLAAHHGDVPPGA